MNRRVVITGFGLISSIGNNSEQALSALLENKSGIVFMKEWKNLGSKSQVCGKIKNLEIEHLRKNIGKESRYMGITSIYALLSSKEAVQKSGLAKEDFYSDKVGCFVGSGNGDTGPVERALMRIHGFHDNRRQLTTYGGDSKNSNATPYDVARSMSGSCSANLTTYYGIKGRSYSISSACATSLHNIGCAYELISDNRCDIAMAGGAEYASSTLAIAFDNMRMAISKGFNTEPQKASRPYDRQRDGFVISGGGAIVVVEELERAKARGATIYAEITGYGATSDG